MVKSPNSWTVSSVFPEIPLARAKWARSFSLEDPRRSHLRWSARPGRSSLAWKSSLHEFNEQLDTVQAHAVALPSQMSLAWSPLELLSRSVSPPPAADRGGISPPGDRSVGPALGPTPGSRDRGDRHGPATKTMFFLYHLYSGFRFVSALPGSLFQVTFPPVFGPASRAPCFVSRPSDESVPVTLNMELWRRESQRRVKRMVRANGNLISGMAFTVLHIRKCIVFDCLWNLTCFMNRL